MERTYNIKGLKCQGCADNVTKRFSALKKVDHVKVDLAKNEVTIWGNPSKWSLKRALKGSNYELGAEV
ncbi:copper chaperone CopZ [Streptococcus macacae]|uniref:Heavy metal-associated domain protein n=1 Tax=Streptococcus macacae NCTC 11558 TaxID=764298 RepID=G5JWU3_9STRE|nr:copper chaperone CopZ [Streptococcus macacae]EHJ52938.1 heavy metal-associated domain protein [Streptococcus macacae NCTC 11558]SUN79051.1 copper-transporting ATPase [Streptococcus macacae NCTC 11558]